MTIQECYQAIGGDYEQAIKRLSSEKMIRRFIGRFLEEDSFQQLYSAIAEKKQAEAFFAAHTLESVSANLSFDKLLASVSALAEIIRAVPDTIPDGAQRLMEEVERDYALTAASIRTCLEGAE